jgi:hypothetical protein
MLPIVQESSQLANVAPVIAVVGLPSHSDARGPQLEQRNEHRVLNGLVEGDNDDETNEPPLNPVSMGNSEVIDSQTFAQNDSVSFRI